jgi:hypothetical protein
MKAIIKSTKEQVELTGYKIVNNKTYLTFKGAAKNTFLSFDSVITLEGNEITPEMFNVAGNEKNNDIQTAKKIFLAVNNKWNENSSYNLACSILNKVNPNDNSFIESLLNSFFHKNFLSEKQAYCLAKYVVENNLF